jgi:hypothetical protein
MSESDSAKKAIYLQTLRYVALLLAILFSAGILLISYSKGLVFFLGFVFGPAITVFLFNVETTRDESSKLTIEAIKMVGIAIILIVFSLYLLSDTTTTKFREHPPSPQHSTTSHPPRPSRPSLPPYIYTIEEYRVTVDAENNLSKNKLQVKEEVIYNKKCLSSSCRKKKSAETQASTFSTNNREVASTNHGFMVQEVYINPLQTNESGVYSLTTLDGTSINIKLCQYGCPEGSITLINFPKNSFYEAKYDTNLQINSYLDTETINWSTKYLNKGITFAYIPPPFYHFKLALKPFLGVASFNQWIVAFLGAVGGIVIVPIVKPILEDIAQNKLISCLQKARLR